MSKPVIINLPGARRDPTSLLIKNHGPEDIYIGKRNQKVIDVFEHPVWVIEPGAQKIVDATSIIVSKNGKSNAEVTEA